MSNQNPQKSITTPLSAEEARKLKAGDSCLISGVIYTARDAAHKRLIEAIESAGDNATGIHLRNRNSDNDKQSKGLPFEIKDAVIYYVGPTPEKPGEVIGSAGPTTSYRMDAFSPTLIALGQTGMIGKGRRSPEVIEAMKKYGAVYFGAIGGAGALLSDCIKSSEVIAYDDLGAEAIRKLEVVDFPVTVVIDSEGNDLYEIGRREYIKSHPTD